MPTACTGSRFLRMMPNNEIPTKNRLKKRCCVHVSFLITPPQEQGIYLNACNNIATVYIVNANIRNNDAYNAGILVLSIINPTTISTSRIGILHTSNGVIQFGKG
jgi:hypothetical protein